jgi:hypothetical protein
MKPFNRRAMYDSPRWPIGQSRLPEMPIDPILAAEARARREAQAKSNREVERQAIKEAETAVALAEAKARTERFDALREKRRRKR